MIVVHVFHIMLSLLLMEGLYDLSGNLYLVINYILLDLTREIDSKFNGTCTKGYVWLKANNWGSFQLQTITNF
jgi:hypothetical protein